jgi:hypothetical protein
MIAPCAVPGPATIRRATIRTSSIGCGARSSHHANAALAPSAGPTTKAEAQPWSGPSISAATRPTIARTDGALPGRSARPLERSTSGGITARASGSATIAIGTLMTNTDCHGKSSSSAPPSSGAMTKPSAAAAPAMPIAVARAGPSNAPYMSAAVLGMRNAAAAPEEVRGPVRSW